MYRFPQNPGPTPPAYRFGHPGPTGKTSPNQSTPVFHKETDPPGSPQMTQLAAIYDWILQEAAAKLDKINQTIAAGGQPQPYRAAVADYEDFLEGLNNQNVPQSNGPAINWAVISPVLTSQGYVAGATVIVKWLGGTHSSSSDIGVP